MSRRPYTFLLAASLGLCAYGAGWLLGREVERGWHGEKGGSKSPSLSSGAFRGARTAGGAGTNAPGGVMDPGSPEHEAKMVGQLKELIQAMDRAGRLDALLDMYQLSPMLYFLPAREYPELWKLLSELRSSEVRERLQQSVLYRWACKDPPAAFAEVLKMPPGARKDSSVDSVLVVWAGQDPVAALARAREMPEGSRRNSALANVLLGIAERDPKAAAQLLGELPVGGYRDWAAERLFAQLALLDLDAAMAMFNPRDERQREQKFWTAAEIRSRRSLPEALAWAQGLGDEQEREIAVGAVIHLMAKAERQQAIDFANSQSDPKERKRLIGSIAWSWAQEDVEAAFAWVKQLPEGPLREAAWNSMRNLADHETAIQFTLASVPPGQKRSLDLQRFADDWIARARPGEDQAALQFAERLAAGPDRDAFLSGLCRGLELDFPEQAARLAVTIGAESPRARAVVQAVQDWAAQDPAGAAAWSAALPEGATRARACSQVVGRWSEMDPAGAVKWLHALPDDPARAAAAASCFSATLGQRTEVAMQALALVPDEEDRNRLIEKTVRDWLEADPEPARAWLEQTSLPAERKERLLKR